MFDDVDNNDEIKATEKLSSEFNIIPSTKTKRYVDNFREGPNRRLVLKKLTLQARSFQIKKYLFANDELKQILKESIPSDMNDEQVAKDLYNLYLGHVAGKNVAILKEF